MNASKTSIEWKRSLLVKMPANCSVVRTYRKKIQLSNLIRSKSQPDQHGEFVARVSNWDWDIFLFIRMTASLTWKM